VQQLIDIAVPGLTFVLLTAVGLDLTGEDFARVRRRPALVLAGVFAPLVVLPPLAIGVAMLFRAPADVTAGVLLIAVSPIGGISNTYSYIARASTALSVTLTGLSCLLAGITVPLLGKAAVLALGPSFALAAPPPALIGRVFLVFALPLALGLALRRWSPALAHGSQATLRRLAFGGIAIVLLLIVAEDVDAFVAGSATEVPLAAVFIVCSAASGWMVAAMVTDESRDRFTLAAEFGTRNVAVAMAIAVTLLGQVEFARFAAIYFLTEVPLMLLAAVLFRRRPGRT
jgi:BASS family bile acid:Na+ symporter